MKGLHFLVLMMMALLVMAACSSQKPSRTEAENPFFSDWKTPFGAPPFEKIKEEHFKPAILEGIRRHQAEIEAIIANPEPPNFANTVEALDRSGLFLDRVELVLDNLLSAHTSDKLQAIATELAPIISRHYDEILLNDRLFKRLKSVYDQKDNLNLHPEQRQLLEKLYLDFVRSGANLDESKKGRLKEINEELAVLSLKFGDNVLKETNSFEMVIENKADLEGLPEEVIAAAAEEARARGKEGKWVFTLQRPSIIPFLQYSSRRDLREKIFKAYINRCNNNNECDNKKIIARIIALRIEKAKLLGYPTWAHYVLEENMAKTPEKVYELLNQIWPRALEKARKEAQELEQLMKEEGQNFKLEPWDWWYYAEKLRKKKYDLDESMLRPYFKLENVINGVFMLATKLYGLQFIERRDIPVYHPDVRAFEVKEADGRSVGLLYTDYFPRASKRAGAWMNAYREAFKINGQRVLPIICNVGNLTKPTQEKPSLLSWEEVTTLFHEFGHALHGLLSECTYLRLTGTNVPRDFVELPSQIMENWVAEPEFLKLFARLYETGEPMPDELITKIRNSQYFNQGFATVEYLAASFLDMDWHTLTEPVKEEEVMDFEAKSLERIGLIPEIIVRYRSPYFNHIFSGGYSAGYYSYIWAEVLDADAFEAFKVKGLFDPETARSFRENILARGGSDDPMKLYLRFRGREPRVEPMLKRRGLL